MWIHCVILSWNFCRYQGITYMTVMTASWVVAV